MNPSTLAAHGRPAHGATTARPTPARGPGGVPASGDEAGGFAGLLQSITPPDDEGGNALASGTSEGADSGVSSRKRNDRSHARATGSHEDAGAAAVPPRDDAAASAVGNGPADASDTEATGQADGEAAEGLAAAGPGGRSPGRGLRGGSLAPQASADPTPLGGHGPLATGLHPHGLPGLASAAHPSTSAAGAPGLATANALAPQPAGRGGVTAAGAGPDIAAAGANAANGAALAAAQDLASGATPAPRADTTSFAATLAGMASDAASAAWTPPATSAATSPVHQAALPFGPHEAGFAGEVAAQVQFMVAGSLQQAELHLNPVDLGPVRITLDVSGNNASIHLAAAHELTREGLLRALPELREALASQGLSLGQADVGTHAGQGRGEGHAQAQDRAAQAWGDATTAASGGAGSDGPSPQRPAALRARAVRGMLDLYA